MRFSEKLKLIREEKQMSLAEFADLLGTSKQVLSRYERGESNPKIATVVHYANVLDVPLAYLIYDEIMDRASPAPKTTTAPTKPELSEGKRKLIEFAESVPEDKIDLVLRVMQSIVEAD
jgi:transcriptional regulator with XRE-family HTH domain